MSTSSAASPSDRPSPRTGMVLRVVGALALGYSAYLHFRIAFDRMPLYDDGQVTLSGLFVAQAVAATLVVLWVLVRGDRLSWLAFGAVAVASLGALVMSVYVRIPAIGPFPVIYEPLWYTDKYLAAASAAVAVVVALVALATARRSPGRSAR